GGDGAVGQGEREVAGRAGGEVDGGDAGREGETLDLSSRGDPPRPEVRVAHPEVSVGPGRDRRRDRYPGGDPELGELSRPGYAPDEPGRVAEPDVSIGPQGEV